MNRKLWGEDDLGFPAETAAPATWNRSNIYEAFLYQSVYFHKNCVSEESWLPCVDGSNCSDSR